MKIDYSKEHYRLNRIKQKHARYNLIYGQRSNGKTYAVIEEMLIKYCTTGKAGAYIRRWEEDFKKGRGTKLWDGIRRDKLVEKYSDGKYNDIIVRGYMVYLCYREEGSKDIIVDDKVFCYYFALTNWEHDKGTDETVITTVCFDECITRTGYLPDEFVIFMNVLSTIIRDRNDVVIYMLGNTISKYCPYFKEMGLTHILEMKRGDIDVYNYGASGLIVAVEYAENYEGNIRSAVYFAFDNPKLNMITGGEWELDIYPHCPIKYVPKDIIFTYFIIFEENTLQCEIICKNGNYFTFVHRKTTPIQNEDKDIIFHLAHDYRQNHYRNIMRLDSNLSFISKFFIMEKVFYQDNEVGNIVENYLIICRKLYRK